MPLDYQHQLNLLRDLLQDHQTDCNGTAAECAQLQRLARQLMNHSDVHEKIKETLQSVHDYSYVGATHQKLDDHIYQHQTHLKNWVDTIDSHHAF
ncbi:YtzH-like family protein [Fictibacillus sp. Mic-4]|uniref:YtzH-like family protein n=1 Tax=Fictibacillus sp. Mic-4 TaxID=3132826 RepID=UPI003CF4BABA